MLIPPGYLRVRSQPLCDCSNVLLYALVPELSRFDAARLRDAPAATACARVARKHRASAH
jgi:hypothetical protein